MNLDEECWKQRQTRQRLEGLAHHCEAMDSLTEGPQRRDLLTRLLIDAVELWQGLAVTHPPSRAYDVLGSTERMCSEFTLEVARALEREVTGEPAQLEWVKLALESFLEHPLPDELAQTALPRPDAHGAS